MHYGGSEQVQENQTKCTIAKDEWKEKTVEQIMVITLYPKVRNKC